MKVMSPHGKFLTFVGYRWRKGSQGIIGTGKDATQVVDVLFNMFLTCNHHSIKPSIKNWLKQQLHFLYSNSPKSFSCSKSKVTLLTIIS